MRVLVVLINTGNYIIKYFMKVVEVAAAGMQVDCVTLQDYLAKDQGGYDVLIYSTFPDESHPVKFDRDLTAKCDDKFQSFKGTRVLLDTHDNGSRDGFARFADFVTPRIKANPSYELMEKMNIMMTLPYVVHHVYQRPQGERSIRLLCAQRTRGMPPNRQQTLNLVGRFEPETKRLRIGQHAKRLCRTLINIVPTGYGDCDRSHVDTLAAGALLMAEERIKDIKILPFADLEEDRNFVSFTPDNICDKLDWLLYNRPLVDRIRLAGLETFRKGYDINRSAQRLQEFL